MTNDVGGTYSNRGLEGPFDTPQQKNEGRDYGRCRLCKKEDCWMAYLYGDGPDAAGR